MGSPRYWTTQLALLLAAVALLTLGHVCDNGFVDLDDPDYVTDNRHVGTGFTWPALHWAWTTFDAGNYHPLTWMSLLGDGWLYGLDPSGYHRTNLLWHVANVVLVFRLWQRLTGATGRAALVAGLFAVHPLHVESVAWVSERKDVLSTFFALLCLHLYTGYVRRPGVLRYLGVCLALALGLLAKPMLVTLPCVLLLLDWWPLGRVGTPTAADDPPPASSGIGRLVLEKLPLCALAATAAVLTLVAQQSVAALTSVSELAAGDRLANAVIGYLWYLEKTFWPAGLAAFYDHPLGAWQGWRLAVGAVVLAAVSVAVWRLRRPAVTVGWLWWLGTLVPVIGLVQVGSQAYADRYTYLPHIGLFVALVWGGADLLAGWRCPVRWRVALGCGLVLALAVPTWLQVRHWRSSRSLWDRAVRLNPDSARAHLGLALVCLGEGNQEGARQHVQALVRLKPRSSYGHYLLGVMDLQRGEYEEAEAHLRESARLHPEVAGTRYQWGKALWGLGRTDLAAEQWHEAARLDPEFADTHEALAEWSLGRGRRQDAIAHLEESLRIAPMGDDAARRRQLLQRLRGSQGPDQ